MLINVMTFILGVIGIAKQELSNTKSNNVRFGAWHP